VLDEAIWGLQWLEKMNPDSGMMFNQIADDRDHSGFRLPTEDTVDYGLGNARPVYFCTGEPQGLMTYKNKTNGIASAAGKFSSVFSLFADLFKMEPERSNHLKQKSIHAYAYGKANPGACQTAPCRAPYYYEEQNWSDDMELAAASLYRLTSQKTYLNDALRFSQSEPVTPWFGADTARHYQWYPFMNMGHYILIENTPDHIREEILGYYVSGLDRIMQKAKDNPFRIGIPFIWCSNNLVTAVLNQCFIYRKLTDNERFYEMECSLRDWLFGCNPWGVSMIVGLPENGTYPKDPHSSLAHLFGYSLNGGLVDGPVSGSIFKNLKYISLTEPDEYKMLQSENCVYHDDVGDYATNEPTMDGTAGLIYYLSALASTKQYKRFR